MLSLVEELFEYEYVPPKAATVEAKNEQEAVILDLLRSKKLQEAFQLLSLVTSSDRLYDLAHEALEIAESLRDSEMIKQLVELQFSKRNKKDFYILAVSALLRLNPDSAVSFVLFTKLSEDEADCGWKILERHYRKQNDLKKLEVIYDHLTEDGNKISLAEYFLNSDEMVKNWQSWIMWFGKYSSLKKASSIIYFRGKAVELLTAQSDVKVVFDVVSRALLENAKQDFLQHLYFHWIKAQEFLRCEQIEKHLPQELSWLMKVRELVRVGANFEILTKISYVEQVWIIPIAVTQLIRTTDAQVPLIPVLVSTAALIPACRDQILETASQQYIELERFDDVICMLSHLSRYHVESTIGSMVLTGKLNEAQQASVIVKVNFDGFMWDRIKASFSPLLIENEQCRRTEESYQQFRKEYLALKNVGKKDKRKFNEICNKLQTLIRHKLYAQALELCAVLAPSDKRDGYVESLIQANASLEPGNFDNCIKASHLYREKTVGASWKNFFGAVRRGNNREIIVASLRCPYKLFAISFVCRAAVQLLNEEDISKPIEFLQNSGFLASEWVTNQVKGRIVEGLFKIFGDDSTKLLNRIKGWRKSGITGLESFISITFLEKDQLENAVKLLNSCLTDTGDEKFDNDQCFNQVNSYLESAEPRKELFATVNTLVNKPARQRLLRVICKVASQLDPEKALDVIRVCPDKELRCEFCESLLESFLVSSQYELANKTMTCLPSELQQYWRPIILGVSKNQFRGVLNHWCITGRFVRGLVEFVVKNWLNDVNRDDVLVEFSSFYQIQEDLSRNRPLVGDADLDESIKRYRAKEDCNRVLNLISLHWCSVYLESNQTTIPETNAGLRIILPWYVSTGQYSDLIEKAKKKVFELARSTSDIESFFLLLFEHRKLESKDIFAIESQWLSSATFGEIERLIHFVRNNKLENLIAGSRYYNLENWERTVHERLIKEYIDKKMFQEVVRFLPDDMSFSERRLLMDCIEQHLQALALPKVQCLIDKLKINLTEDDALRLVSYFLSANYVIEGQALFRLHVKTPTQVHALGKKVVECYWKKLTLLLNPQGDVTVKFICDSYTKVAQVKIALKKGDTNEAIRLQTEIVQDMRRLPEIGFNAYCKRQYPNANFKFLYFPMVPSTEARAPGVRLQELLRGSGLGELHRDNVDMFDFLLNIQPAVDRRQLWLETLFPMSNAIKHDSNITADKVSPDFLTDLVNGVTVILLKLSNPLSPVLELERFLPSVFIDMDRLTSDISHQSDLTL